LNAVHGRLTDREAFDAMAMFLNQYADRAGDDLITLLGDVEIMPSDDMPTDPAAWSDWQACVTAIRARRDGVAN
jgi:hypothetical protein